MLQLVANFLGCLGLAGRIEGWAQARDEKDIGKIILLPPFKNFLAIFSPTSPFHRIGYPSA